MPCDDSRAQQEEENPFFPGVDSTSENPWTLFTQAFPTSPSVKAFSFPWTLWLQALNSNSLLNLNKPIFAGEISSSLSV